MIVTNIGIDIDTHGKKQNKFFMKRMEKHGTIVFKDRSKHGWHYRVELEIPRPIRGLRTWVDIMLLRAWCGDDPARILFDLNRIVHGFTIIDVLFNKKWLGWNVEMIKNETY